MKAPDKMGESPSVETQHTASATPAKGEAPPRKVEAPAKMDGADAPSRVTTTPPKTQTVLPRKVETPQPPKPEMAKLAEPSPVPPTPPPVQATGSDDERRSQAEDMIYATIRIKMEEAIAERAKLLKEGRDPADERVRQLEGTIMRARDLLTENGEVVEDVVPPIVQTQPKP